MKRPDYRTLQALDAVIRERGFERAAQKLCITQSAVSQRIKQLENMFGQPLLVRTVPPRPTEQGQKLLALLRQVELLEEEWLGDEQTGSTPLLLSLAVNADSLATWLLPALANVLSDSPIRLNLQVEDETRTQERLRRGEVVGAVSIQPQALPSCLVDQLGALDYLFVASKEFAQRYFPNGVTRSALLKARSSPSTIWTICIRRSCSKTSTCRRAASPATSSTRRKLSCSWRARAPPAV